MLNLILKKNFTKWMMYIGIVVGGFILIRQIIYSIDSIASLLSVPQGLNNLLLSWCFILIALSVQIFVWILIIKSLGNNISSFKAFIGYSLSFLPRYIPGTVWGYFSRNEWLLFEFNIQRNTSILSMIIEFFVIFGSLIFFVGLPFIPNKLIVYVSLLIILFVIEFLVIRLSINGFHFGKLIEKNNNESMSSISLISLLKIFLLSLLSWILYGISLFFLSGKHRYIISWCQMIEQILQYSSSFATAWFGGFLVFFIPSGIGIRESILANMLQGEIISNAYEAMSISILFRLVISLGEITFIICGLIYRLFYLRRVTRTFEND